MVARIMKNKLDVSAVTKEDITKLGILSDTLTFDDRAIQDGISSQGETFIKACSQMVDEMRILHAVYAQTAAGAESALLALGRGLWAICDRPGTADQPPIMTAVLTENLPKGGVPIVNGETGFKVWLTRTLKQCYMLYPDMGDNRESLLNMPDKASDKDRLKTLKLGETCMVLVQVKYVAGENTLLPHLPRATGEALAFSQLLGLGEMRFILADGVNWMFCILRKNEERWTVYQLPSIQLPKGSLAAPAPRVLFLASEWLNSSKDLGESKLYALD